MTNAQCQRSMNSRLQSSKFPDNAKEFVVESLPDGINDHMLCVHRLWCASLCCGNAEHSLSKLRLWKNNSYRHANKLQRLRNKQFGHKVLLLNYIANCKKAKGIHAVSFN